MLLNNLHHFQTIPNNSFLTFYEFIQDSAFPIGFPDAAYFQHDLNFGCVSMPMTAIGLVVAIASASASASTGTIIGVCFDASDIQMFCEGMMDASQGPLYGIFV